MTREEKIEKRKNRSIRRARKNGERNDNRIRRGMGMDCPYGVDIHGSYGTCHCGGKNYSKCLSDI